MDLRLDDYEQIDEMLTNEDQNIKISKEAFSKEFIGAELKILNICLDIAKCIKINSKGTNLITALQLGFKTVLELGS